MSRRKTTAPKRQAGRSEESGSQPATNPIDYSRSPFAIIESVLSPSGAPVLGLHLHVAHMMLIRSFEEQLGQGEVTANWIGILALVAAHPGISQIDLAKLIRLERATIGDRVSRCLKAGLLRRAGSADDRRKYALYLTQHGSRVLDHFRDSIPAHEREFTAQLTADERDTLRRLLDKLVPAWSESNS